MEDTHIILEVVLRANYDYFNFFLIFQWSSDSVNDMYADAALAVILKVDSNSKQLAIEGKDLECIDYTYNNIIIGKDVSKVSEKKRECKFPDRLLRLMREMFGPQNVNWCLQDNSKIEILSDSKKALLDPCTLTVETSDEHLQHLVAVSAKRLQVSLATTA